MMPKKDTPKNDVKSTKTATENSNPTQTALTAKTKKPAETSLTKPTDSENYSNFDSKKNHSKTRVTVKYDVGFSNNVFIRGKGANLNWDKGTPLKNLKADEWVWETDGNFSQCEFKVLINDRDFEAGENHTVAAGSSVVYTPRF